eukprot:1196330-Prorocentrum_minimum.AAC.1
MGGKPGSGAPPFDRAQGEGSGRKWGTGHRLKERRTLAKLAAAVEEERSRRALGPNLAAGAMDTAGEVDQWETADDEAEVQEVRLLGVDTVTVELTIKTLLSYLIIGEFNSLTDRRGTPAARARHEHCRVDH